MLRKEVLDVVRRIANVRDPVFRELRAEPAADKREYQYPNAQGAGRHYLQEVCCVLAVADKLKVESRAQSVGGARTAVGLQAQRTMYGVI